MDTETEKRPQAVNNLIWIIPDEEKKEKGGLVIPSQGRVKPHFGIIYSVGSNVTEEKIREGRIAIFHRGIGMMLEYDGKNYLILEQQMVIGVDDPDL
ncbi:MAG: hypothetical protein C5B59_07960 [Bacteroidetes bacterium]|nr:MAG: hypothetical protein C5B59_07960 [Bacteroidota bacterium]